MKPYFLTHFRDGKLKARFEHGVIRFASQRAGALLKDVRPDVEATRRRSKVAQGKFKGAWRDYVDHRVRIVQGGVTLSVAEAEKFAELLEEKLAR